MFKNSRIVFLNRIDIQARILPVATAGSRARVLKEWYLSKGGQSAYQQHRYQCKISTTQKRIWYRLLYFNTRGAAEPIRYLMALYNVPYQDVRYPIQAAAKGFGVDETYLKHQAEGRFRANLNKVPILQIVQQWKEQLDGEGDIGSTDSAQEVILDEIGQTHTILRFLDYQHGHHVSLNPLQRAHIDSFVEAIRDVKTAWYKSKTNQKCNEFVSSNLPEWCQKLEQSLPVNESNGDYPWLIGDHPSLADI
ncbi:glutathione S-transferase, N-terminal domain containing protein [Nitzschia inconspicua]|uniref:Glutathione S-transferase, N-terminal domain containing protein n=1 Tax=Nitzschia inconspicua TaxID=303405 RepID=A0A9K3KXI2_9STRA|nr:glutathione S-transferase, N-terminal domain containing protein [Nitzschia inconspicua]